MLFCHLVVFSGLLSSFVVFSLRNCLKQTVFFPASNSSAAKNMETVSFPAVRLVPLVPQWLLVFCRMAQLTFTSVCVLKQLRYPRCTASISSFGVVGDCWRGKKKSTTRSCSAQDKHEKASSTIFTCRFLCADVVISYLIVQRCIVSSYRKLKKQQQPKNR